MRVEIKWVLIIFIVHALWHVAERLLGLYGPLFEFKMLSTVLFLAAYAGLIYLALADMRKANNGYLNRRHAFVSGLFISFILVALAPIMVGLLAFFIQPDYFNVMITNAINDGDYSAYEAAEIDYNYWNTVMNYMAAYLIVGSLSGGLWGYVLHKMPEPVRD